MWKSTDAGANFTQVPTPHGDNHDLWIDPHENRRMIQGNDGGANVSFNAGASWSSIYNQLTAQLYTVDTDGRAPHYFVYGTQQDNSSLGVPSSTNDGAIAWEDCRIAGTGESGYVAVDPRDAGHRLRRRRRQLPGRRRGPAALRPQPPARCDSSTCGPRSTAAWGRESSGTASGGPSRYGSLRTTRTSSTPVATGCSAAPTRGRAGSRSAPISRVRTPTSSDPRAARSPGTRAARSTTARCTPSPSRPTSRECCGRDRTTGLCT